LKPYYQQDKWAIYHGDCREVLPTLSKASAIVTDPPYELGFMGKSWDSQGVSFQKETWEIIRKSCLSGAPLLSFGGTRTFHRIACAIEDAGWEYRDTLMWVYGSGFPKSLDISKAIDKRKGTHPDTSKEFAQYIKSRRLEFGIGLTEADNYVCNGTTNYSWFEGRPAGQRLPRLAEYERIKELLKLDTRFDDFIGEAEREVIGKAPWATLNCAPMTGADCSKENRSIKDITAPTTPEAQLWEGYGTALKPAYEPITLAMNPLDGTFANNALKHGVAGLNIEECRVGTDEIKLNSYKSHGAEGCTAIGGTHKGENYLSEISKGRFPANFIHDGSQMVMELFPDSKGTIRQPTGRGILNPETGWNNNSMIDRTVRGHNDSGSAARFFYCAKASKAERDRGLEDMEGELGHNRFDKCSVCGGYLLQNPDRPSACKCTNPVREHNRVKGNNHPTVKPLALMTYLVKLVKMPEYNLIIDPFCGSGTTLLACIKLGIPCIGIDNDEKSCEIAAKRCSHIVMELA